MVLEVLLEVSCEYGREEDGNSGGEVDVGEISTVIDDGSGDSSSDVDDMFTDGNISEDNFDGVWDINSDD